MREINEALQGCLTEEERVFGAVASDVNINLAEGYPTKCTKCGYAFKPGDEFYYDILDDDKNLDDRCEKCAKGISFMAHSTIKGEKKGAKV